MTPIYYVDTVNSNNFYIKREDFIPFSFGGNKARKAQLFFEEIDEGNFDCVITYGSGSSNHCRVIANLCCLRNIPCFIISPIDSNEKTFNREMMCLFGADIEKVELKDVHDTIERKKRELIVQGKKPYVIEGGGHGNIGTKAYVQCYQEIEKQQRELGVLFDYVFLASGTGTTQAGLVCGKILSKGMQQIVGISIARKNPRGRDVIIDSIRAYLADELLEDELQASTIFVDDYAGGYGKEDLRVMRTVCNALRKYGLPLDMTYTGKAFMGMNEYINKFGIKNKNILFIHTGGTPIFFFFL